MVKRRIKLVLTISVLKIILENDEFLQGRYCWKICQQHAVKERKSEANTGCCLEGGCWLKTRHWGPDRKAGCSSQRNRTSTLESSVCFIIIVPKIVPITNWVSLNSPLDFSLCEATQSSTEGCLSYLDMLRCKEGRKSHENRLSSETPGPSFSGTVWKNSKSMISTSISFWPIQPQHEQRGIKRAIGE